MAFCASITAETHPTTGAQYYALSVTPTEQITDLAECQVVLESGTEYGNWRQLTSLSLDDAQVIGSHIALVWAIAWGFRAIRMAIFSPSERFDHEN